MKKDLLNLTYLTKQEILNLIELAKKIKAHPEKFKFPKVGPSDGPSETLEYSRLIQRIRIIR